MSDNFNMFDRRSPSLEQIDNMLRDENDPKTRSTLLVLQQQIIATTGIVRLIEELRTKIHDRFDEHDEYVKAHQERLDDHEKIVTSAKTSVAWISAIAGAIQACVVGVGVYAYSFIADMNTKVNEHELLLPLVEKKVDWLSDRTESNSDDIMKGDINRIKNKKVIRASK